ncbi:mesotocin receptor-like [Harmonia axyridis]|uniref:mesotocin receptor-like n=1 Tax=Harmonia axyridis TaxID=115357 RepID=UPI001E276C95|nr:mesotocin receptor-like [Harmonia axyridis]
MLQHPNITMNASLASNNSLSTSLRTADLTEPPTGRDEHLALFEVATLAVIFVVTVVGNTTVLLALWARRRYAGRKKLSRMYFFILHLSIADLITAIFSVLPQLAWEVTYRFYGENILCKFIKFSQTLGPYLSSYILMATAVDRHQAICHPLTYCSWTSRRSKVMVYGAWITSLIFCLPQVFIFSYQELSEGEYDCWATFSYSWGERAYVTWYSISIFIVPLIILIFTYTAICRTIWLSSESNLRPRNSQTYQNNGKNRRLPLISRAKINTIKQTIAVIVMYIVCSSPFIVALLWASWDPDNPFKEGVSFVILTLLYSLNSCFNPWIYLAFNRELPRLLLKHCLTSRTNYSAANGGGRTGSNSSGIQTTTLRSFSRWSICNSSKSSKMPLTNGKNLPRPYLAKYKAQRWVVTTPNTMSTAT